MDVAVIIKSLERSSDIAMLGHVSFLPIISPDCGRSSLARQEEKAERPF
jgi:hypothetical protein